MIHRERVTQIAELNLTLQSQSQVCDYSDAYIAFKRTKTVPNTRTAAAPNNRKKEIVFKNCGPFNDCISEIENIYKHL